MATSLYGNEHKIRLEKYYTPEQLELITQFSYAWNFHVLNFSLWRQDLPWQVPERKISDNLIVVVNRGKFAASCGALAAELGPGDGMMVPEFVPHAYRFSTGVSSAETFVIHVLCEHPDRENPFRTLRSPFFRFRHWEAAREELLRIIALRNRNDELAFTGAEQLIRRLFIELAETGVAQASPAATGDQRIAAALEIMRRNPAANLAISDIAAAVALKEVRFRQLFLRDCGISPAVWRHRMRLLHARRMLARYNDSLAVIAVKCGFNSVTYFSSSFRRFFHVTPEQYRKRRQN